MDNTFEIMQPQFQELQDTGILKDENLKKNAASVRFYRNGLPAVILLSNHTLYRGRLYQANTELSLYPSGTPRSGFFAREETFHIDGKNFDFKPKKLITFHDTLVGDVSFGTIANGVRLDSPFSLVVAPGAVNFHLSGAVSICSLLNGISVILGSSEPTVKAASRIQLYDYDSDGSASLASATLADTVKFQNFETMSGTLHVFYRGQTVKNCGNLHQFYSRYDTIEQGFHIAKETQVILYQGGKLKSFQVGATLTFGKLNLTAGDLLSLYETGVAKQWVPSQDVVYNSHNSSAYVPLNFDENGDLI